MVNEITDFVNDKYSFSLYHRCLKMGFANFTDNQKVSFGREASVKKITLDMIGVFYGDRKKLNITNEELCTRVYFSFPSTLPTSSSSTLVGLQTINIQPTSANTISQGSGSVADSEGLTVDLENILFSISYQIVMTVDTGCINCVPYCEWSTCVQEIASCVPLQLGDRSVTIFTTTDEADYPIPEIKYKTIKFVIGERMRLVENTEWTVTTDAEMNPTFHYIDPLNTPVIAGQPITIVYQ